MLTSLFEKKVIICKYFQHLWSKIRKKKKSWDTKLGSNYVIHSSPKVFLKMGIFCNNARKLKSQHITKTMLFFWKSNEISPLCCNFCGKTSSQSKASLFCCNVQWKISTKSRYSKNIWNLQEKKRISPLFCWVYVGIFPHSLKLSANGIRAICHFMQVCLTPCQEKNLKSSDSPLLGGWHQM